MKTLALLAAPAITAAALPAVAGFVQISAGNDHTCAVTAEGAAMCWGSNEYGQLGVGIGGSFPLPVGVRGLASGVVSVAAAAASTCALLADGRARCWGRNNYGQLGNGSNTDSGVPVEVQAVDDAVQVAAGGSNACALRRDGTVSCWGFVSSTFRCNASLSCSTDLEYRDSPRATALPRSAKVAMANGYLTDFAPPPVPGTCVVTPAGGVACIRRIDAEPYPMMAGVDGGVVGLATGVSKSCVIRSSGAIQCWHALAAPAGTDAVLVLEEVLGAAEGALDVSAASNTACAVTAAGSVKCWGGNEVGQLGDGTTTTSEAPVQVAGLRTGFRSVSVGGGHACALDTAGNAWCWGLNARGQLGRVGASSRTPVGVTGFSEPKVIPAMPGAATGLWYDSREPGWGMHVTHRGNTLLMALFAYDAAGAGTWYVATCRLFPISTAADLRCPQSELFQVEGYVFPSGPHVRGAGRTTRAGSLDFRLVRGSGQLTYTVGAASRTVDVTRQVFRGPVGQGVDYTDHWWNPAESGWGLGLVHQGDVMFLAWYAYEASGKAAWYVAPDCAVVGEGCSGALYRASGPPLAGSFDAARVRATQVGAVRARFGDANNGTLDYTIDGTTGSSPITRYLF